MRPMRLSTRHLSVRARLGEVRVELRAIFEQAVTAAVAYTLGTAQRNALDSDQ